MKIEVLVDVKTTLGEGPLWDVEEQRLYWVDSFDGRVFRCTEDGRELRSWDVPQKIGSMCLRKNGGAVVSLQRGLHFLDLKTGEVELIHDPEPEHTQNRLNDGKVDRFGRFFVGSMDCSEDQASGALYRLDPDLKIHQIDTKIVCSNGPCWSPDNQKFYFADTWSGEISVYDFDPKTGNVSNRRSFTSFKGRDGAPDGATVDAEGYVWSALVYGGKLLRFAPDGSVDREIDVPVKKVTSVMFGGSNLDILFVTSMAKRPLPRFPGMECYVAACSPFTISAFKVCLKPGSPGSITGRCIVVFSSSRPSEISFVASANGSGSAGEIVVVARKKWVERSRRDSLPISSLIGL